MWEANRRAKNKENIVNSSGPWFNEIKEKFFENSEWKFVGSLCNNDLVKYFPNPENREEFEICRVMGMSGPDNRFTLKIHNKSSDGFDFRGSPNSLCIEKIQIDALGNIFPAND